MDNFNKILSFILGLVVVIVFLAIITKKVNLSKGLSFLKKSTTGVTVTPTPTKLPTQTVVISGVNPTPVVYNYQTKQPVNSPKSIPATGAPTILLPFAISSLFAGIKLRKTGKK